ncbi:MAG: PHP domain-containing protein [Armatimonadota bacterium]
MPIDLHIHSTASDGTEDPAEIVRAAAQMGLSAIAVVDHDTMAGVPAALDAAQQLPLEVIPAVEINTDYQGTDVHILGYHLDPEDEPLEALLAAVREKRLGRAAEIVRRLKTLGLELEMADVLQVAGEAAVARPHVAAVLHQMGVCSSPQEAFDRFIGRDRPAYVPRYRLTPQQAIEAIAAAGGVPVLGHPGLMNRDRVIAQLLPLGLRGLEAYHVHHSPSATAKYVAMAEKLDLVITGGTDSHGPKGTRPVEIGAVHVPDELLGPLAAAAEEMRAAGA